MCPYRTPLDYDQWTQTWLCLSNIAIIIGGHRGQGSGVGAMVLRVVDDVEKETVHCSDFSLYYSHLKTQKRRREIDKQNNQLRDKQLDCDIRYKINPEIYLWFNNPVNIKYSFWSSSAEHVRPSLK